MQTAAQARRCARRVVLASVLAPALALAQTPAPPPQPDVAFVPTPWEVVDRMLAVARVSEGDVVYDLGCGDGRIVIAAAKHFGARGVGIDINPELITESRRNADSAGVAGRVEFRQADLFQSDFREATVVTLYLGSALNLKLRPKLLAELRPGTRIVSNFFDLGDWGPDSTSRVGVHSVHYWVVPANVGGTWKVAVVGPATGRRYTVRLAQRYQRLSGTATVNGHTLPVADTRLVGDRIAFTVTDTLGKRPVAMRFSGRASGDELTGTVMINGSAERHAWSATWVRTGGATKQGGRRTVAPGMPW